MQVVCPCWKPWTQSCPQLAPLTSPFACHCRMCTRLVVSEASVLELPAGASRLCPPP